MRNIIAVALLPLLFMGCAVGPKYVRPAIQPPATFYAELVSMNGVMAGSIPSLHFG